MGRGRLIATTALVALAGLAPAAAKGPGWGPPGAEGLAYGADLLPRLTPVPRLNGARRPWHLPEAPPGVFGRRGEPPPRTAEPRGELCLIAAGRCSADPCVQRVPAPRALRCDPYPDATPRIVPVR